MTDITDEKMFEMAEQMIARRIENTGESREEASEHIANYLKGLIK